MPKVADVDDPFLVEGLRKAKEKGKESPRAKVSLVARRSVVLSQMDIFRRPIRSLKRVPDVLSAAAEVTLQARRRYPLR